jgi:phosphatidylglycerol:prolipoprotein diacylglycerol transferase
MFPKVISIGAFFLPAYGLLVAAGFLVGLWITARLASRAGLNPQTVTDLGVYVALAGLVGAKLLMMAYDFSYYVEHPGEIFTFATLQAGGVFYGGLIAALLVAIWYVRSNKLEFLPVADAFAPGIAAGHALGRLGCLAAGCCWGIQCDRPWAITFRDPEAHRLVGVPLGVPLHPTQLYEAFAELATFGILYRQLAKSHAPGKIIGLYLIFYPSARFVIEFFRAHDQPNPFAWKLSTAQWITLALIGVGSWLVLRKPGRLAQSA